MLHKIERQVKFRYFSIWISTMQFTKCSKVDCLYFVWREEVQEYISPNFNKLSRSTLYSPIFLFFEQNNCPKLFWIQLIYSKVWVFIKVFQLNWKIVLTTYLTSSNVHFCSHSFLLLEYTYTREIPYFYCYVRKYLSSLNRIQNFQYNILHIFVFWRLYKTVHVFILQDISVFEYSL